MSLCCRCSGKFAGGQIVLHFELKPAPPPFPPSHFLVVSLHPSRGAALTQVLSLRLLQEPQPPASIMSSSNPLCAHPLKRLIGGPVISAGILIVTVKEVVFFFLQSRGRDLDQHEEAHMHTKAQEQNLQATAHTFCWQWSMGQKKTKQNMEPYSQDKWMSMITRGEKAWWETTRGALWYHSSFSVARLQGLQ